MKAANNSGPILNELKKQEHIELSKDNDGKLRTESNAVMDQKLHGSLHPGVHSHKTFGGKKSRDFCNFLVRVDKSVCLCVFVRAC